jgi:transposase
MAPSVHLPSRGAEKNSINPFTTYIYDVIMCIMTDRKETPGIAANNPRSEQHSGAVTPECSLSCHSTAAPSERKDDYVELRELKALELAARARILFNNGFWVVPSQTAPAASYRVTIDPPSCECEDFVLRQQSCKHVIAARFVYERQGGNSAPALDTDAVPKKPVFKQDWPAYGRAQKIEKRRVQELLRDLVSRLPERERDPRRRGPKPHRVCDAIMAMALKVYCGLSSRRLHTDMEIAFEKGYTTKLVPGPKVTAFFEDEYYTPILKDLITFSATPLRPLETRFAIDSSGFSSSCYEDYFDYKHGSGMPRRRCTWVKCHIASGVKTHCVTAIRIMDKDAADSPQFVPLLRETKKGFEIGEVSADKAYASLENFEEIAACGGQGYIAFKSNATGGVGGMFEKAFHMFMANRDEYLDRYHERSNVESTFSAVKRKFGSAVMSETATAQVNECLVKFLLQNLCCLIAVQERLGLVPVFWKDEPIDEEEDDRAIPLRFQAEKTVGNSGRNAIGPSAT